MGKLSQLTTFCTLLFFALKSKFVLQKRGHKLFQSLVSCNHSSLRPEVTLTLTSGSVLADERFSFDIKGCAQQEVVTVTAETEDKDKTFTSYASYTCDQHGCVDPAKSSPISGSFEGCDPMGFIWSMRCLGEPYGRRLLIRDVTVPQRVTFKVFRGQLDLNDKFTSIRDHTPIRGAHVDRWHKADSVQRIEIEHDGVCGTMFIPEGPGPFPGVVDLFGVAGGIMEHKASLLASHGFLTLALAFVNYKTLPKHPSDLNVDYFIKAADYLSSHPLVLPGGVGVFAVSKGSEMMQAATCFGAKVKAIASVNGMPYFTSHSVRYKDEVIQPVFVLDPRKFLEEDGKYIVKSIFKIDSSKMFPVWETDVHLLSICGEEDQLIPPELLHLQYQTYPAHHRHKITLLSYPGAGHLIDPPYCPVVTDSVDNVYKAPLAFGGEPKQHAMAQVDAWQQTIAFLRKHLT